MILRFVSYIAIVIIILFIIPPTPLPVVWSWQRWHHHSTTTTSTATTDDWKDIWGHPVGPRKRQGHSMVVYQSSILIMFGGRDEDRQQPHVPKTFELVQHDGVLEFQSYEDKPIYNYYNYTNDNDKDDNNKGYCQPTKHCVELTNATSGNTQSCLYSWDPPEEEQHTTHHDDGTTNTNDNNYNDGNNNNDDDEWNKQRELLCGYVPVGSYYNDVWMYDLDCLRYGDHACHNNYNNIHNDNNGDENYGDDDDNAEVGWQVLHPGATFGNCSVNPMEEYGGKRKCQIPSERWGHDAEMINEHTMMIYGGFSHECEDYCEDVWLFDLRTLHWTELEMTKNTVPTTTSRLTSATIIQDDSSGLSSISNRPGKRWKFSMVSSASNTENKILLFGGHRLWNGFVNSDGINHGQYDKGGYLSDLWVFTMENSTVFSSSSSPSQDEEEAPSNLSSSSSLLSSSSSSFSGTWTQIHGKESCHPSPNLSWESRNNIECKIFWPTSRAGHVAVTDSENQVMYIHGGYTTYYPYLKRKPTKKGEGGSSSSSSGNTNTYNKYGDRYVPYPSFPFFLDDLWMFNISTGYWTEIVPVTKTKPSRRTDHIMVLTNSNLLVLFGGYANNRHYNDTWYFDLTQKTWLEKTEFVHAYYPEDCTDDLEYIQSEENECVLLEYPKPLQRYNNHHPNHISPDSMTSTTAFLNYQQILPFIDQDGYTPSSENPYYTGIVGNATEFVQHLQEMYQDNEIYDDEENRIWFPPSLVPDGTPIAPYAATGPNQYAQIKRIQYNETFHLDVWEWCTSVKGGPTRHIKGNWSEDVLIPQRRRMSPGWDGCRELKWKFPFARSNHYGIFVKKYDMLVIYGGIGYDETTLEETENKGRNDLSLNAFSQKTYPTVILDDMWVLNIHNCIHNCSNNGVCTNGFCKCDPGYYGIDCSNYTCPGSVCYYDDGKDDGFGIFGNKPEQHCTHCCQDGYVHTDEDVYIPDIRKFPCRYKIVQERYNDGIDSLFTGSSQGICDGFGSCQCAPGFLGEDCSMKDCKNNCSFHGFCSVEYPVSRCACQAGYFGEYCQYKECLNNCSYPNGICNFETGICSCGEIYDPYVLDRIWGLWEGEDCSFLTPWCAASSLGKNWLSFIILLFCTILLLYNQRF